MALEEHALESAGERCEERVTRLTLREMQAVLESGGPTLCAIHASEAAPIGDEAGGTDAGDAR